MGRRATDKDKERLIFLLLALCLAQGLASCYLSYRAMTAIGFLEDVGEEMRKSKRLEY